MHIFLSIALFVYATARIATAVRLFVTLYDGNVTTLALEASSKGYILTATSQSHDCGSQPSWMVYDQPNRILYCMDENFQADPARPSAIFTSFHVGSDGMLTTAAKENIRTAASVSAALFNNNQSMAVAGYSGQVSVFSVNGPTFQQMGVLDFSNSTSLGPIRPEQGTAHPHQVVLDPSGGFVVVPDLGADVVRIFSWSIDSSTPPTLVPRDHAIQMPPGTGPRHVAFMEQRAADDSASTTYLYVLGELSNTITTYEVSYSLEGSLNFKEVDVQNTFGGRNLLNGPRAAELQVSPDHRFLLVSSRNDSTFEVTSSYSNGSICVKEYSDALNTFAILDDGKLQFKDASAAGGSFPRHFSIDRTGTKVAVALQNSCRVVIYSRNVESGMLGCELARLQLGNCDPNVGKQAAPSMIIWDE